MTGSVPAPASAAPTAGSNGAATTLASYRRGARSTVEESPAVASWATDSPAAIATVGPCAESRRTAGPVRAPSPTIVAPRVEATPRIWSTMSAAPVVAVVDKPGSPTLASAPRSACAYTVGATHEALGQRPELAEPVHRRVLAGSGVRRGIQPALRVVVDDVARRHGVHGDQEVGVDGQTQCAAGLSAGVDRGTDREVDGRQQCVETSACRE